MMLPSDRDAISTSVGTWHSIMTVKCLAFNDTGWRPRFKLLTPLSSWAVHACGRGQCWDCRVFYIFVSTSVTLRPVSMISNCMQLHGFPRYLAVFHLSPHQVTTGESSSFLSFSVKQKHGPLPDNSWGIWMCLTNGVRLRHILWISWTAHISNEEIHRRTDQPPLTHIIQKFFGHIAHADPSMHHSWALRASMAPLPSDWTTDWANRISSGSVLLNPIWDHSTLVWQPPIVECRIIKPGACS